MLVTQDIFHKKKHEKFKKKSSYQSTKSEDVVTSCVINFNTTCFYGDFRLIFTILNFIAINHCAVNFFYNFIYLFY